MYDKKSSFLIKSASYASVTIASTLLVIKIFSWVETGSQSILASLVDSLLDISSSLLNLLAVRIFLVPPDNNHRFGHDKFQDLAIFSQSVFFFLSCSVALFSSFKMLFKGGEVQNVEYGVNAMYVCVSLTFLLVCYQYYVVKQTKAKIIMADKLHYFTDFLTNIIVIISLNLSSKYWFIDPIGGILIALYLMHGSYKLFRSAVKNLVDEEFEEEDKQKLLSIIKKFDEVHGIHELKTRWAGNKAFIQFHVELDSHLSLKKAHDISHKIEHAIHEEFHGADIIIHQDIVGDEDEVQYREELK